MKKININFDVPCYILEEIQQYIKLTENGYCKNMKWENIKALLNLAVINNRITDKQATYLKETFCREKI